MSRNPSQYGSLSHQLDYVLPQRHLERRERFAPGSLQETAPRICSEEAETDEDYVVVNVVKSASSRG